MRLWIGLSSLLIGCNLDGAGKTGPVDSVLSGEGSDEDGDGFSVSTGDCDDGDPEISPTAEEVCDGLDNNCDGETDEGVQLTFYADADADSYGDGAAPLSACEQPEGTVLEATDCDDAAADRFPMNPEICDGVDNDCNGAVDDGIEVLWFVDADEDGYGDPQVTEAGCIQPDGTVPNADDCDDSTEDASPEGVEVCDELDNDCNGIVDDGVSTTFYGDLDGDGYGSPLLTQAACTPPVGYVAGDTDCDDVLASVYPGAAEVCDGVDQDCDGQTDEGATDAITWYADGDGDGYGEAGVWLTSCTQPGGFVADGTDCDDGAAASHPGAAEVCGGADEDCDGQTDEASASDAPLWYADGDQDGYGDGRVAQAACSPPAGYVADGTDCFDGAASAYPGAVEVCDGLDNNCDGAFDEPTAADAVTWYADSDGDGFGDAAVAVQDCDQPAGYEADALDCDDARIDVWPAAPEYCDGADNDCDGAVDDNALDAITFYADADVDGYGDAGVTARACAVPPGYLSNVGDCNDRNGGIYTGAMEYCDGIDNDCDGVVDDGATNAGTWYLDADQDGYGNSAITIQSCSQPSGYVSQGGDCNDVSALASPGLSERCDSVDNDCDGQTDESSAVDARTWYTDSDGDGYGNPATAQTACAQPVGTVLTGGDCDDSRAASSPAGTEACNGYDDDCDGQTDESSAVDAAAWYRDADADGYGSASSSQRACTQPVGYVASAADCNDANSNISPADTEVCNGLDDDCDGTADEDSAQGAPTWYLDADSDGYGGSASRAACSQPAGYVSNASDCNDGSAAISPADPEVCNGSDDDCDGQTDEAGAAGSVTWYRDADQDGYGASGTSTISCTQPAGYVSNATDCNDASAAISPGDTEACNGYDDDCDGQTDEAGATGSSTYYRDADSDTYGSAASTAQGCSQPAGYVSNATDCNDGSAAIRPGAREVCDGGVDNDCDGAGDEAYASTNFNSGLDTSLFSANGVATATNNYIRLTPASNSQSGALFLRTTVPDDRLYVSFTFSMGGGSGADGLALVFLNSSDYTQIGGGGGSQGYAGLNGWGVEFDSYYNAGYDPNENHVALTTASTLTDIANSTAIPELEDTGNHTATVYFDNGAVQVYMDGTRYINTSIPNYSAYGISNLLVGLTAATGGATNIHSIDDLTIGCY